MNVLDINFVLQQQNLFVLHIIPRGQKITYIYINNRFGHLELSTVEFRFCWNSGREAIKAQVKPP